MTTTTSTARQRAPHHAEPHCAVQAERFLEDGHLRDRSVLISTYRIFPTPRRHDQPRTRVTGLDGKTYTRGRSARVGAITQRAGRSVLPRCPTPLSQFGPQAEPNAPSPTPTGEGAFWLRKVRPPSPYPRGNIIARARRPHNPDEHYRSALQECTTGVHYRSALQECTFATAKGLRDLRSPFVLYASRTSPRLFGVQRP